MTGFSLFVPGRPAPQGSKRHVGNGVMVESSKALAPWRTLVAWSVAQAWGESPLSGAVRVRLEFVMPRPVSAPKRSTPPAIKRPDADKLARAILDSLSGVCWRDDAQVVDLHASKRIAELDEPPGVLIHVASEMDAEALIACPLPGSRESEENARALTSGPSAGAA